MEIVLILPFPFAVLLFLLGALAPILAPTIAVAILAPYLPFLGFCSMVLITIQIYIWYFKEKI